MGWRKSMRMDAHHPFDEMPPHKRPRHEQETPAESEVDRISDLPEGALHHLLSLMPAHDAVRTCVLGQRWRHLWRSAPAIRFTTFDRSIRSADRFNQFVDRLLLLRCHGAPLESCDFLLVETEVYSDVFLAANERTVSGWISRVLRLQVRVLRFCIGFDDLFWLPDTPLFSQHLTVLELNGVTTNERVLDFSGCPLLVDLKMEGCFANSDKMSSSSVKHLRMSSCMFYDNHRTRLSLPNIVSLELDYIPSRTPLLESMPSLVTAIVRLGCESCDRCEEGEPGGCDDHKWALCDPSRDIKWCPTFSKLKTLVLDEWFATDDLSALIWFLQHSPILEKLSLQLPVVVPKKSVRRYSPIEQSVASDYLELVEIKCQEIDEMVVAILEILNVLTLYVRVSTPNRDRAAMVKLPLGRVVVIQTPNPKLPIPISYEIKILNAIR
ncbi:hypothetical protein QYE76_009284 [Lolium multiflorum]|uniref:F-box domain-containing protein n=1 Tax=Lolium multiflorum TaxID=4521 RepID=A0AAD8TTD2_LOLMU|nr:hypothetical protein QYE76_009284 [Lolium multiflorum]